MIVLTYPPVTGMAEKEVPEGTGFFSPDGKRFEMEWQCECGRVHFVAYDLVGLRHHDDGNKRVYEFIGVVQY